LAKGVPEPIKAVQMLLLACSPHVGKRKNVAKAETFTLAEIHVKRPQTPWSITSTV